MASENFNDYTELDPNTHIGVSASLLDVNGMTNQEDARVHDDKGAEHFGATFEHDVKVVVRSTPGGTYGPSYWAVSNRVDDCDDWDDNSREAVRGYIKKFFTASKWTLKDSETADEDETAPFSPTRTRYLTFERTSETAVECRIYTDAGRESLEDTLSITITSGRRYQHVFGCNSENDGGGGSTTFDVGPLDLNEVATVYEEGTKVQTVKVAVLEEDLHIVGTEHLIATVLVVVEEQDLLSSTSEYHVQAVVPQIIIYDRISPPYDDEFLTQTVLVDTVLWEQMVFGPEHRIQQVLVSVDVTDAQGYAPEYLTQIVLVNTLAQDLRELPEAVIVPVTPRVLVRDVLSLPILVHPSEDDTVRVLSWTAGDVPAGTVFYVVADGEIFARTSGHVLEIPHDQEIRQILDVLVKPAGESDEEFESHLTTPLDRTRLEWTTEDGVYFEVYRKLGTGAYELIDVVSGD